MTFEEAKRILHPDTTRETVKELALDGVNTVKAVEEACIVACEAIDKVIAGQWVPVGEKLPELEQKVLACGAHHGMEVQQYHGSRFAADGHCVWIWKHNTVKTVTHWMPLPEPPEEGQT